MLAEASLIVESIPREALFLAGKAFLQYRRQKGTKQGVLPDFFIGAHAAILGIPLLRRDAECFYEDGRCPQQAVCIPGGGH
ncbi:type II toxin-antitoxin system VapC family toxin [Methylococcus geothermalis]|uniref:PIN domain-containing protein n=1 Tax=Methylococcus geothermalis TaxID=2681310 RepID=A0A858QBK2_9GAMM|nr:hypothetical protein [Methylococcus geothermalis]QJD31161.1 hypothetical protein GNH96_15240 [Methylococcus geothermalis]